MSQLDPAAVTSVAHFRSSLSKAPLEQQEKNKLCEEHTGTEERDKVQRHKRTQHVQETEKDQPTGRAKRRLKKWTVPLGRVVWTMVTNPQAFRTQQQQQNHMSWFLKICLFLQKVNWQRKRASIQLATAYLDQARSQKLHSWSPTRVTWAKLFRLSLATFPGS